MTLLAVWVRTTGRDEELVLAADSRLTGGLRWDGCPKIVALPRSDCLLAFAGDTYLSYPLMLQVQNAFAAFEAIRTRRMDLVGAMHHALRVVNQMKLGIDSWPSDGERDYSDTLFLLAGFSWRRSRYEVWRLVYRRRHRKFRFLQVTGIRGLGENRLVHFAGDETSRATSALARYLAANGTLTSGAVDMEPMQALLEVAMDESDATRSIGGAPQVAKIYRHQNINHFAVQWPPGSQEAYFFGRRVLPAEKVNVPVMSLVGDFHIDYGNPRAKAGQRLDPTDDTWSNPFPSRHTCGIE
jgi:hypothetical protein